MTSEPKASRVLRDHTHTFTADMPVYPGDPHPSITQTSFLERDGYNEYCFHGGMHVGTHIDAPLHMVRDGTSVSEIPISKFFGRGRVVDAQGRDAIDMQALGATELSEGDIVIVATGWSGKFRTNAYYESFPEVDLEFAQHLVERRVAILALDTPSPDRYPFPIHKLLLGNGVLIIENLTDTESLVGAGDFEVIALPAKFQWDGAPVRVVTSRN